jgi:L-iditol 2-dehydrogenase
MLAAVYYSNKDIRIEERPKPQIGADELLVKVMASGICGSDVMEWYRIKSAPRILGHEIAGTVVEAGKNVNTFAVGDRVFVSHHVPCYECRYCKRGAHTQCETLTSTNFDPGGFAQYIRVPAINVRYGTFLLPDSVSFDEGTFVEPLGCVVRGQRIAGVAADNTVLVIGSGISGILHIQLAKAKGVTRIIATDINEHRLMMAERFGAHHVLNARAETQSQLREINEGRGVDIVIVCTAALEAIDTAFTSVDRGGTVLLFAPTPPGVRVPLPLYELYFKGARIVFSYAAVVDDIKEALTLLSSKSVDVLGMVTHRLALQDIQQGVDLVAQADTSLKVIIHPWGQA